MFFYYQNMVKTMCDERKEEASNNMFFYHKSKILKSLFYQLKFQKLIKNIVEYEQHLFDKAGLIYQEAEDLLMNQTVSENYKIDTNKINTKTYSSSFQTSGRLDAEYYLPKYEQIASKITSQSHGRLEDLTEIIKSIEPGTANYSDKGIPFIRVADYNKFGINKYEICIKDKYCKKMQRR